MSKLKTTLLVAVLLLNTALAGGALYVANLSKPADYGDTSGLLAQGAGEIAQVAGYTVDAEAGDVAVPLKAMQRGGNFRIDFTAGKETAVGRQEHTGTWDELGGAVVYRPAEGDRLAELVAIEVTFAITSMRTDALPLTNTVLAGEKWFDYENHPTAVFVCDNVTEIITKVAPAEPDAPTHTFQGRFTLNGISHDIAIPAILTFSGKTLTLDASFEILRSDYAVEKREGSLAGTAGGAVSEVDDAVQLRVRMTVSPDPSAVIAELAGVVEAQREQLDKLNGTLARMESRMRIVESWESRIGSGAQSPGSGTPIDTERLPDRFTDFSPEYTQVPQTDAPPLIKIKNQAPFEMILVPGNTESGISPFYMSKLEVTWAMFEAWSYCRDIVDPHEAEHLIEDLGLRPSPLYGDPMVIVQIDQPGNPVRAISRLTAEDFCKWLSEQTGRRYRLPTEAEWEHALVLGGGVPDDLDAYAWYFENAPYDEFFGDAPASPEAVQEAPSAGSKRPNSLGIHDMLGSVSEWVIPENAAERALRGGNIQTQMNDLTLDWRDVEDPIAWHALYPQAESRYWYPSYQFGGIRLVCDAQSVIDNPPTGEAPQGQGE